jgi:hypothetical protein
MIGSLVGDLLALAGEAGDLVIVSVTPLFFS